jgi:glutamate N-acetyltransferase/amino-acid N-acetyltransferase
VHGARTADDARQVARTIANSPLVKTAVHGADPNWGRIVCAAGRSGVALDINRMTVRIGGVLLFENGLPHDDAAPQAEALLKHDIVDIDVSLGAGDAAATIWGCDLSAEYVRINGEYRT